MLLQWEHASLFRQPKNPDVLFLPRARAQGWGGSACVSRAICTWGELRAQLQLVTSPTWSKCPCQQHSNPGKIWGAKQHLLFTCKQKKSCCSFPKPLVWLFSVFAGDLKHSNTSLFPPAISSLPPLTWPDVNPAFRLDPHFEVSSKNNAVAKCTIAICSLFYKALITQFAR